eukprot:Gb_23623 [translate_table: standard]
MVQEGALTALASVADSSKEHFQKYYDAVMPYLKAILVNATDKSNRMLRAKSMECISLVGMAVGKDKFRHDAKQVCGNAILKVVRESVQLSSLIPSRIPDVLASEGWLHNCFAMAFWSCFLVIGTSPSSDRPLISWIARLVMLSLSGSMGTIPMAEANELGS